MKYIPIGEAARFLNVHPQTLRLYEANKLVRPVKRNGRRYFTPYELEWIRCLREILRRERLSLRAVRKLLKYQPCWRLKGCKNRNCHRWGKGWRSK